MKPFTVIDRARKQGLQGPQQSILVILATHYNEKKGTFPSLKTLARESGFGLTTVKKAVRSLEANKILRVERGGGRGCGGGRWSNSYIFPDLDSVAEGGKRAGPKRYRGRLRPVTGVG